MLAAEALAVAGGGAPSAAGSGDTRRVLVGTQVEDPGTHLFAGLIHPAMVGQVVVK